MCFTSFFKMKNSEKMNNNNLIKNLNEIKTNYNVNIPLESIFIRQRSNTCPILNLGTQSKKLKLNSKVIILGTDNVEHRVPQYVGVEGIIIGVPGTSIYSIISLFF